MRVEKREKKRSGVIYESGKKVEWREEIMEERIEENGGKNKARSPLKNFRIFLVEKKKKLEFGLSLKPRNTG